jgi:glycosyltransferase involved in cell wall biosynthesis
MASGVPVVASGTGGSCTYLRDGRNALVTGPAAPARLAAAVRALGADARLRARLAAGGRATAAAYGEDRCSAVVADRLEALADRTGPLARQGRTGRSNRHAGRGVQAAIS